MSGALRSQTLHEVVVLPVRIAMGHSAVQATTRALTPDAAFVRSLSLSLPLPGLKLGLRLYLPSGVAEDIRAVVAHRPPPDGETGFWADFVALSPSTRSRIVSLLASKSNDPAGTPPAPGLATAPAHGGAPPASGSPAAASRSPAPRAPAARATSRGKVLRRPVLSPQAKARAAQRSGADLRSTTRISASLRVRFRTAADLKEEMTVNISAGGMFIRTDTPPPMREMVTVSIELPGETTPIEAQAEVVHRVTREEGRLTGRPAGAGVQFIEADDRFRETLDAWIAKQDV